MPSGKKIDQKIRDAAVLAYYEGERTVDQIAVENGIARRTMYQWIEIYGRGRRVHDPKKPRRGILFSLEETELLLSMISMCDKGLSKRDLGTLYSIEQRLLNAADDLYLKIEAAKSKEG